MLIGREVIREYTSTEIVPGDNAPVAILELVDNPRDLRWEITSRAVGWEMLKNKLKEEEPLSLIQKGAPDAQKFIQHERGLDENSSGVLRPKTRWNLQKILRYKGQDGTITLGRKVEEYFVSLLVPGYGHILNNCTGSRSSVDGGYQSPG